MSRSLLILVLTCITLSPVKNGTAADPAVDLPPLPFAQRYLLMKQECLDRDWSQIKCELGVSSSDGMSLQMRPYDPIYTFGEVEITGSLSGLKRVIDRYVTPPGGCGETARLTRMQDLLLEKVQSDLKIYAKENKLNECGKACLATCASSQILQYNVKNKSIPEYQPAYILSKGDGLCRHFSNLADAFMDSLAIPSRPVGGEVMQDGKFVGYHAWISVQVQGNEYWMDPQRNECKFFRADPVKWK